MEEILMVKDLPLIPKQSTSNNSGSAPLFVIGVIILIVAAIVLFNLFKKDNEVNA